MNVSNATVRLFFPRDFSTGRGPGPRSFSARGGVASHRRFLSLISHGSDPMVFCHRTVSHSGRVTREKAEQGERAGAGGEETSTR